MESTPWPREERSSVLCFYCKNFSHTPWRCEKHKQDEAVRSKESGGPWGPKVNQATAVKKIEGSVTPPPVTDPQWFHEYKEVATEVASQEDGEQEEDQSPPYARVNVISIKGKARKHSLLASELPKLSVSTLVSPTQCNGWSSCGMSRCSWENETCLFFQGGTLGLIPQVCT